jgi:hypothetical protein
MTLDDVLQDLINYLGSKGGDSISWEQVREWPEDAVKIFQSAGWINQKNSAKSIVCPGCEENCFMPVHVYPSVKDKPTRIVVACDQRDDMGLIPIPADNLQQWQITENQVVRWIAHSLGLKGKPKKDKKSGSTHIGNVQGKKNIGLLEWIVQKPVSLKVSGHTLALIEVIYFKSNQLLVDNAAIINMVDMSPTERYEPSIVRQEASKLNTQAKHKGLQKAYRKLKKENPGESGEWYSFEISKKDIGKGFQPETIRKIMKR